MRLNMSEPELLFENIDSYVYRPKPRASFTNGPIMKCIDIMTKPLINHYKYIIQEIQKLHIPLSRIPYHNSIENDPNWDNGFMPPLDAAMIYTTLAIHNPTFYFEIGSGNSTKFARRSITDNKLKTKIISVDPYPRAEIDEICDAVFRVPIENFDIEFIKLLPSDSIIICDNSHRAFANSDVTVFFTEIIPMLPRGCIYSIHDIFLPYEVYCDWFYNEQYMLTSYLLGGADNDKLYFPTHYLQLHTNLLYDLTIELECKTPINLSDNGSFFWMRR